MSAIGGHWVLLLSFKDKVAITNATSIDLVASDLVWTDVTPKMSKSLGGWSTKKILLILLIIFIVFIAIVVGIYRYKEGKWPLIG